MIGIILAATLSVSPTCESLGKFAETIMTSRQNDVPLISVMEDYKNAYIKSSLDHTVTSLTLSTIVIAYKAPIVENKQALISEFGTITRNACTNAGF